MTLWAHLVISEGKAGYWKPFINASWSMMASPSLLSKLILTPPNLSHGILSLVAWYTGNVLLAFYLIMAPTYHRYFIMTCVKR